ncbi:transporter substrate-binding domain-containing protein [Rhodobacter sp. 24-YEA-8]|uniref:transporter substrate-binding domain-containing protein n=1 Tax=Rhodobacter sp. 24-YEA-8 TaxID=1884310 RepID=UPI000896F598|nr:transporter substrate-binding domain-containing protein [Rhodobacter sp. 24-YEA-8]SED50912.1 amino acid ABC transporter substrate-binding protein, PAAT family [Rhodobacter sp. 24-YEA-8]
MLRRTLLAALVGATTLTGAGFAAADTLEDIRTRGKILVGIDLNFPPFGTLDADLKPVGSDVAAAKMLAEHLGVDLEIVELNGPNRVPYLLTSNVDVVISSFSITPERQEVIDFSYPYSASESSIMAPAEVNISTLEDLAGKRIGVVRGNLQDTLLVPIVPEGTQLVRFDDDASNVVALLSGQVVAIGASAELLPSITQRAPDKNIERKLAIKIVPQGIGVRKEEPALLAAVNEFVLTNLENGRLKETYAENVGFPLADLSEYLPK